MSIMCCARRAPDRRDKCSRHPRQAVRMQQTPVGRVIATFGRHMLVRAAGGQALPARPFGRSLGAVCGDEVRYRIDTRHEEVHVVEVLPRRTALWRTSKRGGAEAVVANLTQLLVVLAP